MGTDARQVSKFLTLLLRHEPERIGIELDEAGWTDVDALLAALRAHGVALTRAELEHVVATSDKQRFSFSLDGTKIRANQGHSIPVELGLTALAPPEVLYHGTTSAALPGIRARGLVKGQRHHVHLSADVETAKKVGGRRGKPVVLAIRAGEMHRAGHAFFRSDNGVWLVDHVPAPYIEPDGAVPSVDLVPRGGDSASRKRNSEIAKQSLAACDAGFYTNARGVRVEIADAIARAKAGTTLYERGVSRLELSGKRAVPAAIRVTGETTIEAIVRLARSGGHVGCLNFASAKRPGGGFLGGAQAQEESLARASALYPCLVTQETFYARNKASGSGLYLDLAIYSPHVPFFRDDRGGWLGAPVLASVITAAAPNARALRDAGAFRPEEVANALRGRSELVLAIAAHHGIERLVLGAWGAGVFGNDPALVAGIFRELLAGPFAHAFVEVVFAVKGTPETSANHRAFAEVFRYARHS